MPAEHHTSLLVFCALGLYVLTENRPSLYSKLVSFNAVCLCEVNITCVAIRCVPAARRCNIIRIVSAISFLHSGPSGGQSVGVGADSSALEEVAPELVVVQLFLSTVLECGAEGAVPHTTVRTGRGGVFPVSCDNVNGHLAKHTSLLSAQSLSVFVHLSLSVTRAASEGGD